MKIPEDKKSLTGVIPHEKANVNFSSDLFSYVFLYDTIYNNNNPKSIYLLPKDEFIKGKTFNGYDIAIYLGKNAFQIEGSRELNSDCFIVSSGNVYEQDINKFTGIEFRGGTLNQLFYRNSLTIERGKESKIKYRDDSINFQFHDKDDIVKVEIFSTPEETNGINGTNLKTSDVVLRLYFNKEKGLCDFLKHYNRIKEMMSFLSFRNNVGFDYISLLRKENELNFDYYSEVAYAYLNEKTPYTDKMLYRNICFEDVKENLPALLEILYDDNEKKSTYSFGFLPENDKDVFRVSEQKIRAICSSLECELPFRKTENNENAEIKKLIKTVKNAINEFKKTSEYIEEKTYDSIGGTFAHWGAPLSEKIISAYEEYLEIIKYIIPHSIKIYDDSIREFVKYRNDITHGRSRILSKDIASTAYALEGLAYCMFLSRIGLSKEKIRNISSNKIIK